jgi:hypothetical protein
MLLNFRFPSYNGDMTDPALPTDTIATPDKAWAETVKNMLRAEMVRHGASYAMLAQRLGELGVEDNELNLRNKVSRGRFTAVFLLQCFKALGAEWVQVPASIEDAGQKGGAQVLARKTKGPQDA